MSQVKSRVSEQMRSVAEDSKDFVGEHAMPSALIAFGIGVGAGLMVASLLADSLPARHTSMTQRLGQQMLDAMGSVVPQSFMKH
ncbi:MAG TPA: hypothetical protein VMM76_20455 [Pirellulaceae bacterium]|nr:hypothetical protein [Pirellulaceae bacterium]